MKTGKKKKKEQGKNKYPKVRAKIDEWASTGEKCSFMLPPNPNPSATNPPKAKRSQNVSRPRTKSLQIRGSRTHLSPRLF